MGLFVTKGRKKNNNFNGKLVHLKFNYMTNIVQYNNVSVLWHSMKSN